MTEETKPTTEATVTVKSVRAVQNEMERHFYANSQKATDYAKSDALRAVTSTKPEERASYEARVKEYVLEASIWEKALDLLKYARYTDALDRMEAKFGKAPKFSPWDAE